MSVKLDRQLDILVELDVLVRGIGCAGVTAGKDILIGSV